MTNSCNGTFTCSLYQKETIALRTRSKLPLTTEDVEQLEANFIAPDITADMYDTDCDYDDDWNKFLRELMQVKFAVQYLVT